MMTVTAGSRIPAKQTGRLGTETVSAEGFIRLAASHGLSGRTHVTIKGAARVTCHKLPVPFVLNAWCRPVSYLTATPHPARPACLVVTYFTRLPKAGEVQ